MNCRSKTGLFLIELLMMILLFSFSAAVCLRIFASAKSASSFSRDLTAATMNAQSAAECYKAFDGDMERTAKGLSGKYNGDTVTLYYDEKWERAPGDGSAFTMTLTKRDGCAVIDVEQSGKPELLFSITVKAVAHGD